MIIISHSNDKQGAHDIREALRRGETQATAYGLIKIGVLVRDESKAAISLRPNKPGSKCVTLWFE